MSASYGRGWRALREAAFALYGRQCHLRLEGCTNYADTVDHLDAVALAGSRLPTIDRVRPACRHCNFSHGATLGNALRKGQLPAAPTRPHQPKPSRDWFGTASRPTDES
jgi:hypothetical protein